MLRFQSSVSNSIARPYLLYSSWSELRSRFGRRANIPYARTVALYVRAAVELDLYTVVSVSTTAILFAIVAHVILQRPRRRSAARHKSRSPSTWSICWTRSSPRLRAAVIVVYVSLRVVHALLLTFSVTSLFLQVMMIDAIIILIFNYLYY